MTKIAVLGGGPMGLATAYRLSQEGHAVDLYEADDRLGGMTASFDFDGTRIERYYHFLCKTDYPLFDYLDELNLSHLLRWQDTSMGFFHKGTLHSWGTPFSLLKFPHLSLVSKIRYGLHVLATGRVNDWSTLDKVNAVAWIKRWIGEDAYNVLWKSLFELKFYDYTDNLSAAWIGTRIKRVGKSRKSIFQESLGYLEGGSEMLIRGLSRKIREKGGTVHLDSPIQEVCGSAGKITGVRVGRDFRPHDCVISTVPLPYVPRLVPELPMSERKQIEAIHNIGVVCVLLKLTKPISPHFWMNINEPSIEIPGIIEYTNLNPLTKDQHLVYLPYYLPQQHPRYRAPEDWFYDEACTYLAKVNPDFTRDWIKAAHFHRYRYAQTVCQPGFAGALPPMQSELSGFFMADTSYYYPEDRSMSESLRVGDELAHKVNRWAKVRELPLQEVGGKESGQLARALRR